MAVRTVLTAEKSNILDAIDDYAAKRALTNRNVVVREASANLLGIEIARQ